MTVSSTTNRWGYTGNGATTAFAYDNRIFAATDLKVYVDAVLKTNVTDYTVSGVGETSGGSVTFGTAPANGTVIRIVKDVPRTQGLDFEDLGSFPAENNEKGLDRLTIILQQAYELLTLSMRAPNTDPIGTDMVLPAKASRLGKYLYFNATTGLPEMVSSITGIAAGALLTALADDADAAAGRATLGSTSIGDALFVIASAAAARTLLGLVIGTDVLAPNGSGTSLTGVVKTASTATLTAGYSATPFDAGTKSSGTFTPDEANGNLQRYINGGAHTLAPPTNNCSIVIQVTNNGSAGAITTSGFTKVTGDTLTTTNGDDYLLFITKINGFSHLHKQLLQ